MPSLSVNQWRTIRAVIAALASYGLATNLHPDVVLIPAVSFVLGGVLVALAVIDQPQDTPSPGGG